MPPSPPPPIVSLPSLITPKKWSSNIIEAIWFRNVKLSHIHTWKYYVIHIVLHELNHYWVKVMYKIFGFKLNKYHVSQDYIILDWISLGVIMSTYRLMKYQTHVSAGLVVFWILFEISVCAKKKRKKKVSNTCSIAMLCEPILGSCMSLWLRSRWDVPHLPNHEVGIISLLWYIWL